MTQIIERPPSYGDDAHEPPLFTPVPTADESDDGAGDQPGAARRDGRRRPGAGLRRGRGRRSAACSG